MYKVLKTKTFCDTIDVWETECVFSCDKARNDVFKPQAIVSKNYRQWVSMRDPKTCLLCKYMHGRIYTGTEPINERPPGHPACRCELLPLGAVFAGQATNDGEQGADWYLKNIGSLPSYYISEKRLTALGWRRGDKPAKFVSGKMLTKGVYQNREGKLPQRAGRVWYEADINYYSGVRNQHRIFWSNDGLIFVTYNHGLDFYEII